MMSICLGFGLFFIFVTKAAGLYCLSCTNSVSPRHCHTVRKCSEGEVCFTESHLSENGIVVFDSGCGSVQACHSNRNTSDNQKRQHGVDPHYHHSRCVECCTSDLCNNAGCGQKGYPSARGPVCFDCPQVSDPALCDTIKVCDQNQECYVQQEEEFGDIFYTTSCISKHACTSSKDIFGKRNVEHCSKCCPLNLCNTECDAMSSLPTIYSTTETTLKTEAPSNPTGSRGTEFFVLFMKNHPHATGLLKTYITTNNTSSLNITSSRNLNQTMKHQIDRNITFTSYTNISFPFDLAVHELTTEYKAVIIRSTELSTVTLFDADRSSTNDGTLVIPTNKLSTNYLVSTIKGYDFGFDFENQFAIGILHNKTQLNIKFNIGDNESLVVHGQLFSSGNVYSHTFGELETLQVSHKGDLTGTYITSNKPVAVFSGTECNKFLSYTTCSHMLSQLPPIDQFDNEYIIPPFYDNSGTFIQVVSPFHSNVNTITGNSTSRYHLNDQEHKNITVTTDNVTIVKSERPVMVTGYAMGSQFHDPYMTVIPGINQYLDYYKIVVPDQYRDNYLCVIIPTGSSNNLHINQLSIGQFNTVYQRAVDSSGKTFNVRTFRVQEGVYTLKTTDREPFGLIVYGHRTDDGYGFAGNFVLP
nr:IgGFc-binding protein-like isoform X2 [Crassostrea gigas]